MELIKNYIGGKWVAGEKGQTFESLNPANGEVLAIAVHSDAGDIANAVEAAKAAYPEWRLMPAPRRGEILFNLARVLEANKDRLASLMTQEMGKILAETRGDVQEAIDMAYYMGGEGRRLFGYTAPVEMYNKFGMAVR
ncbi:MAG: aldehyde dehydrogenase family protein, partial [Phototrophicaceae bacterium]